MSEKKRTYELKERARRQAETRQRIVEETVALHEEVGPARTTVAEIARRAGVQRLTVYTHFPDDRDLFAACSQHFMAGHAPPDPGAWAALPDARERLRRALADIHAWFASGEAMFANVERDSAALPALREVVAAGAGPWDAAVRDVLAAGLVKRRGSAADRRVRAAIGLATGFGAWQALVRREGATAKDAVEILAGAVEAAAP
jgi:AcrR family transcriptional regulator